MPWEPPESDLTESKAWTPPSSDIDEANRDTLKAPSLGQRIQHGIESLAPSLLSTEEVQATGKPRGFLPALISGLSESPISGTIPRAETTLESPIIKKIGAGVADVGSGLVESMGSPLGFASTITAGPLKTGGKVIASILTPIIGKQGAEILSEGIENKDPRAMTEGTLLLGGAGLGRRHALKGEAVAIPEKTVNISEAPLVPPDPGSPVGVAPQLFPPKVAETTQALEIKPELVPPLKLSTATTPLAKKEETSLSPEVVSQAISQGPGAASPGDVPPAPPSASASNAAFPEIQNPVATPSAPFLSRAIQFLRGASTELKGMGGNSMPRTTAAYGPVGEAGVRYASSKIAAKPLSALFSTHTLEGTGVDPFKFGVALTEDNLRSIREDARQRATVLLSEGKPEEAARAAAEGDKVTSLVGEENSPFKSEEEYQDFLQEPSTQKAVAQHIQQWNEVVDPMYREAMSLDPDVELPSRGQQTGARINLKAVFPEDEIAPKKVVGPGTAPSLLNTFKRKSPFGVRAKGTGQVYEGDYHSIIANTFERQLEIANKNAFDKQLVEAGLAEIGKPGQRIEIGGKPAASFPLSRKLIINTKDGKTQTFPKGENIYVRSDLAGEYRRAANVDPSHKIPYVTEFMNMLNKTALAGLTDITVHMSNQATALFNRPVSGKLMADSFLSALGRADIPVTLVKAVLKAGKDNQSQLAELSKIGAARQEHIGSAGPLGYTGRLLEKTDKITRLMLDDTFKQLVKDGLVPDTETARREYVNQIGQYNRRLQGPAMRLLRDTGFGPFATAGRTFNALGVKMATLSPGTKASSNLAAAALRANVLSKWIGGVVLLGTVNYLLTKDKGGGVMGRPGTPLGKLDTGLNDKNDRPLQVPFFDIIGLGRALRVTGSGAAINAKRFGLTDADAFDSAARDIINSGIGPAAGPPVRFGMTLGTGFPPAVQVGRSSPVVPPGENQVAENAKEALKQSNPVVGTYFDWKAGKSLPEVIAHQIPRFTMSPGRSAEMMKNYPLIVHRAQASAFIDDVIGRARKMEPEARLKYLQDSIGRLKDDSDKDHAMREFKRRKIIP